MSLLAPDETFENIFIFIPKSKPPKIKVSVFYMPFFSRNSSLLKPKGYIHLATNIVEYHKEAQEFGEKALGLQQIQKPRIECS